MDSIDLLTNSERLIFGNIITLTAIEVAHFFLSTSYVTKYIESENSDYEKEFIDKLLSIDSGNVRVNFDVHCYMARRL